jgi:predicted DNA-binding transcriptional regulator YafY
MPPLVLTPEEAVAVHLGASLVEKTWGRLYREAAQGALAKLDNLLPDEQRQEAAWAQRSLLAIGMQRSNLERLEPTLEALRGAARQLHRVRLLYRSSNRPEPERRDVDPFALVYRWGWWYLVGYCHLRKAMRSFRLDRILEVNILVETFKIPESFDIQQYLAREFQPQPQLLMRLRFSSQAALVALDNRSLWESLEEGADGSVTVTTLTPDIMWGTSMALSFGPIVEVLEPDEIRLSVQEWAQGVLEHYASTTNPTNLARW